MTQPDEFQRAFAAVSPLRRAVTWGLVLVCLAGAAWGARPAWRTLKVWRADGFMREAIEFQKEEQMSLAFERVRSALQLDPDRMDALRLSARLQTLVGSEASIQAWQRVLDSAESTREDRVAYLEAALAFERPDLAAARVPEVVAQADLTGRESRLVAVYHLSRNETVEATRFARLAVKHEPVNPTNVLFLASLLSVEASDSARNEARRLLWSVADHPDTNAIGPTVRVEALRRVGSEEVGQRDDRERIVARLESVEPRSVREDILLAETRIQLDPSCADAVVAALLAMLPREDWEHLELACEALLRRGRAAEVVQLTGAGRGMVNRRLFLARHEALRAAGEGEESYRHLLQTDTPLPPFDLELARVRAASDLGDARRRDAHLKDLLRAAGEHPLRIRRVAALAEAAGTREALAVAEDAWTRIGARAAQRIESLRHLQRLADRRGDTWTAREHARRVRHLGAEDEELKLELAYYDLLLEEEPGPALAEAERQVAADPKDPFPRAVAALAYLRAGRPEAARLALDRVALESTSRPGLLAVVVAAYAANGHEARARELASQLVLARLRPEERTLITRWVVPAPAGAELIGVAR
ncbi:MAG: hypothetical protein IT580_04015 [Verrucomicrobiales bacterium]|nr:hypothetical protein [Verrucomicrobiales bacterium]